MTRPGHGPYWLLCYVALAAAEGVAFGWCFLLVLLHLDIGGLGRLIHGTAGGGVGLAALAAAFAITFSLVGLGWRIMVCLPRED